MTYVSSIVAGEGWNSWLLLSSRGGIRRVGSTEGDLMRREEKLHVGVGCELACYMVCKANSHAVEKTLGDVLQAGGLSSIE